METVKLLGLTISNLTWNAYIKEVVRKSAKRLYFLVQLKHSKVPTNDLVLFYKACIRSNGLCGSRVLSCLTPITYKRIDLSRKMSNVIIFPKINYNLALEKAAFLMAFFLYDPAYPLHYLKSKQRFGCQNVSL